MNSWGDRSAGSIEGEDGAEGEDDGEADGYTDGEGEEIK